MWIFFDESICDRGTGELGGEDRTGGKNQTEPGKVFSRTEIAKRKNQENLSTTFVEKSIMFMLDKKGTLKGKLRKILKEK